MVRFVSQKRVRINPYQPLTVSLSSHQDFNAGPGLFLRFVSGRLSEPEGKGNAITEKFQECNLCQSKENCFLAFMRSSFFFSVTDER